MSRARFSPRRLGFFRLGAALAGFALASTASAASPPDKSGVKPSVISLPSGAGSIEGLGESFEPQLNTGGSSYGVSISLPPGRAGLAPSIRLGYNSFSGNGLAGVGWSLEFMTVKRQTDKGFPEYDPGDTFIFDGEELVPLSNAEQDWRCENERNFQRLRRIDWDGDGLPDAWEVTERNGTKHTLGRFRGQDNRWSVVENPEKASAQPFDRVYSWMLDSTTDLHGNRIEYEYTRGVGVLYPSRITYAHLSNNFHEVTFQYEARPDAFDDYRPAFASRLNARLKRIEVRSRGQLVRAYNLAYEYEPGDLTPAEVALQSTYLDLGVTLLKRVVQVDRSGNEANYLPPLVFTYSGLDLTKAEQRGFSSPPELDLAEPSGRVQLADLDGDALPDLFATTAEGATTVQRVALNRGESRLSGQPRLTFAPAKLALGSSPVDLAEPNTVVHDPKGKGLVDMSSLSDEGGNKRLETFGNRARLDVVDEDRLGFSQENFEATVLASPPAFVTYSHPGTRQMDVNFDKRGDFVNLEPGFGAMTVNTFFVDRQGNWVAGESSLPASYPLANTFQDANGEPNPCVHLADMNGDRLLDLVCLAPSPSGAGQRIRVSYWPLSGRGRYADEHAMPTTEPDTFEIANADLRDVFLDDITGDGLADILVLDGSGPATVLSLRVNIAGQRWSPPYTRTGLPRYAPRDPDQPTIVRLADLNANGSLDILFRNTAPDDTWTYLEVLPQGAPNLMIGIDNGLGRRTAIAYGSAAEDEQLAREGGHPWKTFAPIPLQVVRRIRTSCGLDLNGDGKEDTAVAEFRYRDPYYDGLEREFRGFAFAQRIDYGDDFLFDPVTGLMQVSTGWDPSRTPTGQRSGPSLVTRHRFYTGAADQSDNDDYVGLPPPDRKIDELTETGGREEEPLKGLERVTEQVDPVVLHSAPDGSFDEGCEAAYIATAPDGQTKLTPDAYVYTRSRQTWTLRRLYRPAEPLPYFADQDANGILEDYRSAPVAPLPAGRFAGQGISVLAGNGRSVSFVFSSRQATEVRDANGLLSVALSYPQVGQTSITKTFDHDDYGNQTVMWDLGLDDPAYDDERVTTTTYALGGNALSLWVINKPDSVAVTDENGVFVRKSVFFYDGQPFVGVQAQIQDRALENRRLDFITPQQSIPGVRSRHDGYGNVVETMDPMGNSRRVAWDETLQTYPVAETIVVGAGRPELTIEAEYDLSLGVITRSKDFNGNFTSYFYDSFGRLVKTVRPGDTADAPTASFEYQPADPGRGRVFRYDAAGNLTVAVAPLGSANRVTTRQREQAGAAAEYVTVTYTDGSGRTLATVEEGGAPDTWIVRQATSYNLRGSVQTQWLPYQVSSAGVPQFPAIWPSGRPPQSDGVNPAIVGTDFFHDPLGRELKTSTPPDVWGGARSETRTYHLPAQQWLFDEEDLRAGSAQANTPRLEFHDGLGRVIAVEESVQLTDTGEPGPATRWRTGYRYDLNDQLIEITDSQQNLKRMTYDGLKRMTLLEDPDRGETTFAYDDAGNLRESIDAKGQKVTYTYDGANRILAEKYHNGSTNAADVEYFYDTPAADIDLGDGTRGAGRNALGQIAYVRDESGETHFSYDARARVEWEVKRVRDSSSTAMVSYRTRYSYDSADRLTVLTYPDGDEAQHSYNARNLLNRVYGASLGDVVAGVSYRPSGQIDQITYGNAVRTLHTYDPRLRLSHIETGKQAGPKLMSTAYTYDGLANVKRIEDQRDLTGQPEAAQRYNTQNFGYDSLSRLIRVEYPNPVNSSSNHVAYRYDRIGNMLSQTSDLTQTENGLPVANIGAMTSGGALGRSGRGPRRASDPPGPHALTAAPSRTYSYDANGNVTAMDGLSLEWDFKDRLLAAEDATMRAEYIYDHVGRRVTKTVHWKSVHPGHGDEPSRLNPAWRQETTHYINRYYEVRKHDASVKYIWNKQTRVARVTTSLAATTKIQRLKLYAGWNLVSSRVAGQFSALDPASNSDLGACFLQSPGAPDNEWIEVDSTTSIPAGGTLWVYARKDAIVVLTGVAGQDLLPSLSGQSQFVGNPMAEPVDLRALAPPGATLAQFDSFLHHWDFRFPDAQGGGIQSPGSLLVRPGRVAWASGAASSTLSQTLTPLQVRYYHQDHLGSTTVVTDRDGAIVEESSNFPFGHPRYRYEPRGLEDEPYQFSQKERDAESGLHYFEARYLASVPGRFVSVDPIFTVDMKGLGRLPQTLNVYGYANNNPLKYSDPMGLEVQATTTENAKTGEKTTNIKLTGAIIDETGDMSIWQMYSTLIRVQGQLISDFTGSDAGEKHKWNITLDIRVAFKKSDLKASDHVIRIMDVVDPDDPGTLGEVNKIGGKEVRIKAGLIPKRPSDPGNSSLERTASHEIGHTLGLRHDTDGDNPIRNKMQPRNLMRQTKHTDGHQVNVHQIREIQRLYNDKKLNQ